MLTSNLLHPFDVEFFICSKTDTNRKLRGLCICFVTCVMYTEWGGGDIGIQSSTSSRCRIQSTVDHRNEFNTNTSLDDSQRLQGGYTFEGPRFYARDFAVFKRPDQGVKAVKSKDNVFVTSLLNLRPGNRASKHDTYERFIGSLPRTQAVKTRSGVGTSILPATDASWMDVDQRRMVR